MAKINSQSDHLNTA